MRTLFAFLRNDLGALRIDAVILGAGVLTLLALAATELFDAGAGLLVSAADASLDQTTAGAEVVALDGATAQ